MKKYVRKGVVALGITALVLMMNTDAGAAGSVAVDKPAADFTLMDHQGKKVSLSDFKGKYVVLEWINYECPYDVKHYSTGNMQALQKKYMDKGVVWLAICSSGPGQQGNYTPQEVQRRMKGYNSTVSAYLMDGNGAVGHLYGATNTPHMYIVDPAGVLVYMGAIDDKPTTNRADVPTAKNYVQIALDAAMAGQPVPVKSTKAYG